MPTNASILADYASGIGTQGTTLTIDGDLKRVGIGTTLPTSTLDVNGDVNVTGVITATSFYGDGSNLTGIDTDNALYSETAGIATYATTAGIATYATTAGIATYAATAGIATYATTAGIATNAQGLTGNPSISVTDITATGNVSIAGTLTYEDVTNVDSIGIITARTGVRVTTGGIEVSGGGASITGVVTASNLLATESRVVTLSEKVSRVNGNVVNLVYNSNSSNIGLCTNASGDITLNVTGIPVTSDFDNHVLTFNVFVEQTGTARTCTAVTLNGVSETIHWAGGSLASAIAGVTTTNGTDIFTFTGINTVGSASTTLNYKVLGMVNGGFR